MKWIYGVCTGLVLLFSLLTLRTFKTPFNTDSYYYYNAGASLATGEGLTDHYLWMYVNAPAELPTESHRYWMPLTSLLTALPMTLFGVGYTQAQVSLIPCWLGLVWLGIWLTGQLSTKRRHQWVVGLILTFSGFYLPFWLTTDTFALFGMVGAGALIALGLGQRAEDWRWFALAGVLGALGHLARADGILLVLVGVWVILLSKLPATLKGKFLAALLISYLLVMLPWFIRSYQVLGAPLPAGGIGTAFLRGYNDLFSYPAEWDFQYLWDWGLNNVGQSRVEGILIAFQTWLAVETLIILAPFALWAVWKHRQNPLIAPMFWYALGLHFAMSVIFTYPGSRGGLFHSSSALFPFWMILGVLGLDDAIAWLAKKRHWNTTQAQAVFGLSVLALPLYLGFAAWTNQSRVLDDQPTYQTYADLIPPDARLMANDPAAWYYHTGLTGVTLPDESLETAYILAQKYCLTHLILDKNVTDAFVPLMTEQLDPPDFLTLLHHLDGETPTDFNDDVRIYAFDLTCSTQEEQ